MKQRSGDGQVTNRRSAVGHFGERRFGTFFFSKLRHMFVIYIPVFVSF
nr:MAG TPA: hypothetical protein [Bacteriophage sp.]